MVQGSSAPSSSAPSSSAPIWDQADEWAQKLNKPWALIYTLAAAGAIGSILIVSGIIGMFTSGFLGMGSPIIGMLTNIPTIIWGCVVIGVGVAVAIMYQIMIAPRIENDDMDKSSDIWLCILTVAVLVCGGLPGLMLLAISHMKLGFGANPIYEHW